MSGSSFFSRLATTAFFLGVVVVRFCLVKWYFELPSGYVLTMPGALYRAFDYAWWLFALGGVSVVVAIVCSIWE
jgi:hypothetical protein